MPPPTEATADALSDRAKWQLAFGFRGTVDLLYDKYPPPCKPRLPTPSDRAAPWREVTFPESIEDLLGNPTASHILYAIRRGDQAGSTNFIISGGGGCGKRSALRILTRELQEAGPCVFLTFDAKQLPERDLVTKLENAVKTTDTAKATYLVVENFEVVSTAIQQHHILPLIGVCNTKNAFAVLVLRPDATKLPDQIKQRACLIHMKRLEAVLVREKLLQICMRYWVGYQRDGIEELLKTCGFDVLSCMARLQHTFLAHHFISLANVHKTATSKTDAWIATTHTAASPCNPLPQRPPYPLSILVMNEPLRRCKVCTLAPPCSHMTMLQLYERVNHIRQFYPRGICRNIQSIGRCRYAHPRDIHIIDKAPLVTRCEQHTLPLPCIHCHHIQQSKQQLRESEQEIAKLQKELAVNKKLLLDKESERFMFVREQAKTVKWGAARREFEEKLRVIDLTVQSMHQTVGNQQQELVARRQDALQLTGDIHRGRTKRLGKGNGHLAILGV